MPGLKNGILATGAATTCTCRCHEERTSPVHGYLHSMVEIGLLKILLDHGVLDAIPDDDSSDGGGDGICIAELAARTGAEPGLLGRFADFLHAARFLSSPLSSSSPAPSSPAPPAPGRSQNSHSQDQDQDWHRDRDQGLQLGKEEEENGRGRRVAHTALSRSITRDAGARSLFSHAFDFLLIPATEWSEYFDTNGLVEPGCASHSSASPSRSPSSLSDPARPDTANDDDGGARTGPAGTEMTTPFALAAGRPQSSPREILDTMPARAESLRWVFDAAFGGAGAETLYDFSWVGDYAAATAAAPVDVNGKGSGKSGGLGGTRALVVDIGGGDGRALRGILDAEPRIPAERCVLQDRAEVIRDAGGGGATVNGGGLPPMKKMVADVFEEQPVKGALVYHLGNTLRARPDEDSAQILARIRAACAPDSRVLIAETPLLFRPSSPAPAAEPVAEGKRERERHKEARHPSALDAATADLWLLNFGGRVRRERELAALAARAGLRVSAVFRSAAGVRGSAAAAYEGVDVAGAAVVELVPV